MDRALFTVGIGGFTGKKQRVCHCVGELPGHFSQAGRRETIGALTEWISRPIVDITRS